jgi:subfamily B ATP-binding cassette protein MsbA
MLAAKRLKKLSKKSQEKNSDIVSRLTEVFNNSEIIKANATEKFELDRFNNENWKFFKLSMKSVYTNALISPLLEIIGASGLAAVIYVGGMEVYESNMTAGEFTAFLTAVGLVFQPIRRISSIYGNVQDAIAATERIIQILDITNKVKDGELVLDNRVETIIFQDTALYYKDLKALDNINLTIKAGDNIALVGDSGGGKSSMLNLLLRFYDANEGKLLINNEPIQNYTQKSLRHQISIVSQRVYIFQDTLAKNVAYGEDIVDEEKVIEALTLADAIDFVNELEDGIYTVMSEVGSNLSGGQRQRIAIARAIYKHASLLLFDEATSALDNKSEKRIQNAIDKYSKDKITITIAHRLSTVKHADKILVFKKGMIVDSGTHIELIQNSSEYKRLSGVLA